MTLIFFPLFRFKSTYLIPSSLLQKGSLCKAGATSCVTAAFPGNCAEDARQARELLSHRMRAVECSALHYKGLVPSFRHIQLLDETHPHVTAV